MTLNTAERLIFTVTGSLVVLALSGTVCFAAVQSLTSGDGGLQNLLYGGIIGTSAFGGGAIFTALGIQQAQRGTSTGSSTVTVPNPPDPPITVRTGEDA